VHLRYNCISEDGRCKASGADKGKGQGLPAGLS
jgi:hypothetical protein